MFDYSAPKTIPLSSFVTSNVKLECMTLNFNIDM